MSDDILAVYREIRANCRAWAATIPPPPEPFRFRLSCLLADAHNGARLLARPDRAPKPRAARPARQLRPRPREPVALPPTPSVCPPPFGGRCKWCGVPHDELNPGCLNCIARHAQRRRKLELAEAA